MMNRACFLEDSGVLKGSSSSYNMLRQGRLRVGAGMGSSSSSSS